ncbi:MAG: hypothetical protein IKR21_04950, partial [Oscillospiraceae bacterium]|nr:hypothetical protein [Oscillospiraceae bacterium]
IIMLAGGGLAAVTTDAGTDAELQKNIGIIVIAGIAAVLSGVLTLIQGFASLSAAKNGKKHLLVRIFAILSIILAIIEAVICLIGGNLNGVNLISLIVSLVISVIVLLAANTVRKSAKSQITE